MFANDSLLFARATKEEVDNVLDVLAIYEAASGWKLNMEKFEVSFSRNIDLEKKNLLLERLNFKVVEDHDNYIGLLTYVGRFQKEFF